MANLKVLSAGAMKYVVTGLASKFGGNVDATFGTIATVRKRLQAGETADVLIGTIPAVEEWQCSGAILAGSRKDIGRTLTGLGVRDGTPVPDISTTERFKQAMLNARSIALTDPEMGGSSVIYMVGLLERLGILDAVRRKALLCVDGIVVVDKVLAGEAELASTFLSEIVPRHGMTSAGPLPAEIGHGTSYAVGIAANSANRGEAQRFIDLLTNSGSDFLASRGFEPV